MASATPTSTGPADSPAESHLNQGPALERGPSRTGDDGATTVLPSLTPDVRASFAHCHDVTRRRARNFYYGLKLTPEPRRSAIFAVYAFMRACDDLADGTEPEFVTFDSRRRLERIEAFRQTMGRVLSASKGVRLSAGSLWPALHEVIHTFGIDPLHLHAMLDGQRSDVLRRRFATFEDLYAYCYQVASSVGLVCIKIWGHDGHNRMPKLAENRGIAFQLTNILRDLSEDVRRDRIYLPTDELERFGCTPGQLLTAEADENFDRLMSFQIERARAYYDRSEALESHLEPDCRATSWAMLQIYRRLLERIAAKPRRVLTERVRLRAIQKLTIALRAKGRWRCS